MPVFRFQSLYLWCLCVLRFGVQRSCMYGKGRCSFLIKIFCGAVRWLVQLVETVAQLIDTRVTNAASFLHVFELAYPRMRTVVVCDLLFVFRRQKTYFNEDSCGHSLRMRTSAWPSHCDTTCFFQHIPFPVHNMPVPICTADAAMLPRFQHASAYLRLRTVCCGFRMYTQAHENVWSDTKFVDSSNGIQVRTHV